MATYTLFLFLHNKIEAKSPAFFNEYREAHADHKRVCEVWRKAGRPSEHCHPAKSAVLHSRRNLQKIGRDEESSKSIKFHDEIMQTFHTNMYE